MVGGERSIKAESLLAVLPGKLLVRYQASWDCGSWVWGACMQGLSTRTEKPPGSCESYKLGSLSVPLHFKAGAQEAPSSMLG